MQAKKIELDWDKYFSHSTDLPLEMIRDEKTGLQRSATSKAAFEKWLKLMTEAITEKEAVEKGLAYVKVSRETLEKHAIKGQELALLSDEELYKLNPEFYLRMCGLR